MVAERSSLKLLTTEKPQSLVDENVVNRVAVEKPREKMELITQKDQPGDEYIRTQNQKTDKAIDVTVVFGETVTQMQTMHRVGEGNLTSEFGSDLRYNERRHATFGERHSKGEFTSKSS